MHVTLIKILRYNFFQLCLTHMSTAVCPSPHTELSLCLCRIRYQLSSHLLSLAAGQQVVVSNVFGALLQAA